MVNKADSQFFSSPLNTSSNSSPKEQIEKNQVINDSEVKSIAIQIFKNKSKIDGPPAKMLKKEEIESQFEALTIAQNKALQNVKSIRLDNVNIITEFAEKYNIALDIDEVGKKVTLQNAGATLENNKQKISNNLKNKNIAISTDISSQNHFFGKLLPAEPTTLTTNTDSSSPPTYNIHISKELRMQFPEIASYEIVHENGEPDASYQFIDMSEEDHHEMIQLLTKYYDSCLQLHQLEIHLQNLMDQLQKTKDEISDTKKSSKTPAPPPPTKIRDQSRIKSENPLETADEKYIKIDQNPSGLAALAEQNKRLRDSKRETAQLRKEAKAEVVEHKRLNHEERDVQATKSDTKVRDVAAKIVESDNKQRDYIPEPGTTTQLSRTAHPPKPPMP